MFFLGYFKTKDICTYIIYSYIKEIGLKIKGGPKKSDSDGVFSALLANLLVWQSILQNKYKIYEDKFFKT